MARLKEYYKENVAPAMSEKFKYENPMQIPRMVKIVVNMGVGEGSRSQDLIDSERTGHHYGSVAEDHQGAQVHREF